MQGSPAPALAESARPSQAFEDAGGDYWVVNDLVLVRHHVLQRRGLYVAEEDDPNLPLPLKFFDVTRTTSQYHCTEITEDFKDFKKGVIFTI